MLVEGLGEYLNPSTQIHPAELPYEIVVAPQEFKRLPDGTTYVAQNIYVKNENIKKILMGTKASAIKTVFASAQHDMENLWGRRVHLYLSVKVRK